MRLSRAVLVAFGVSAGVVGIGWHATGWGQAAGSSGSAAATGSAVAQPASQASSVTTLRVTSQETVVNVTVTDAKGHAVHGLKQSDFTVEEDGKPQTIVGGSFREIGAETPLTTRTPPKLPPNVYTNLQPAPTTSAVNILLIDALNTTLANQVIIKREAVNYLKSMPVGTKTAVLAMSTNLRVLQGFTSDTAVLVAAMNSKKNMAIPSPFDTSDSTDALDSAADDQMELGNADTAAMVTQFENEISNQQKDVRNLMTLEALDQIAAYVQGVKGRKNLIWFTAGMPLTIFPVGGTSDLAEMTDFSKELRKTTDLLTAAEIAVYPVDPRGVFGNPSNGADQHVSTISANTGSKVAVSNGAFLQKKSQDELSMEAVAEATGGVAYYNSNDIKSLIGKAIENGANYYTFSYIPPSVEFDGRYHAINVKVDRPKLVLGYRQGYNADDIQHNQITSVLPLTTTAPLPYGSNMQASMGRGVPTASQILFDVAVTPSVGPAQPAGSPVLGTIDGALKDKPLVRYDFQYSLPSRQITFAGQPDGTLRCSLEFDIAAYDVYGKRITGLSQSISPRPITVDKYKQMLKQPLQFYQQIDLPAGEIFLRVGVLDRVSDRVGTMEIPVTVKRKPVVAASVSGSKNGD